MKKISSLNTFSYRIDGATVVELSPEGTIVSDTQAAFIKGRLGNNVSVEDVDVEAEIEKVIEETATEEAPAVEEESVDEAPVVEETISEETATEEAPKAKKGGKTKSK